MTLFDVLNLYSARHLLGANSCTEIKHRRAIRVAGQVVGRIPTTDDLSDDLVCGAMAIVARRGRSPHTVNDTRAKLVALWSFAAKRGFVKQWPDVDRMTAPKLAPVAWLKDELPRVFAACDRALWSVAGIPGPAWLRAFLSVQWDTAERIGALMQLKWTALSGNVLTVPAATRKGKTRDMAYTLHPDTVAALDTLQAHHSGPRIFPVDFNPGTIWNRWRSCLRAEGLPHDRKHMFHCMRRSVASHAKAAGADASELLDHSSSQITREFYLDPRIVPAPKAIDVLFRPI